MTGVTTVLSIFSNLSRVYLLHAWPFLLAHISIAVWTFGLYREIRRETVALKRWKPGTRGPTECTAALNQFVKETEAWGRQGILVPMTDFSDRLDSRTTALIDSLHSRINLFLIIGIAGTFYAMFAFAQDASTSFQLFAGREAEIAREISRKLAYGLAQAFPVGFFGLALTMIGHLFAFQADKRLRGAVGDAAERAMEARAVAAQGPAASIIEALAPLRNLEATLRESLQPVIAGFERQLHDTSQLMRTQIQPLEHAISGFSTAVEDLVPTAASLRSAAEALPPAMCRIAEMQIESRQHLEHMQHMIEATRDALRSASDRMQNAAAALEGLPSRLEGQLAQELQAMSAGLGNLFQPACESLNESANSLAVSAADLNSVPSRLTTTFQCELTGMTAQALTTWDRTGKEFARTVSDSSLQYTSAIAQAARTAQQQLVGAAQNMNEMSITARAVLEGALVRFLEAGRDTLAPVVRDIDEAVQKRLPDVLERLKSAAECAGGLGVSAAQVKAEIAATSEALAAATSSWNSLTAQIEGAARKFERTPPPVVLPPANSNGQAEDVRQIRVAVGQISAKLDRRWWWPFNRAATGDGV